MPPRGGIQIGEINTLRSGGAAAEFHRLADVPPEVAWFTDISNRHTGRAYEKAVKYFMRFAGIGRPEEFHRDPSPHHRLAR